MFYQSLVVDFAFYLQWENHQGNADENDHQQLGRPDPWRDVPVAHSGEGHDAEIQRVKNSQVLPSSLEVLDPTSSAEKHIIQQHHRINSHRLRQLKLYTHEEMKRTISPGEFNLPEIKVHKKAASSSSSSSVFYNDNTDCSVSSTSLLVLIYLCFFHR